MICGTDTEVSSNPSGWYARDEQALMRGVNVSQVPVNSTPAQMRQFTQANPLLDNIIFHSEFGRTQYTFDNKCAISGVAKKELCRVYLEF